MVKTVFVDLQNDLFDRQGICALSSVLKKNNIDVYYICQTNFKRALSSIVSINPDLILYSSLSSALSLYADFDKLAKQTIKAVSVIGGPGPTYDTKLLEETTIDAACVGEGEYALVDFIRNGFIGHKNIFCRGSAPPSIFHELVDLNTLPFPDRDIVYQADRVRRNMPSKQFLSGRGCPYRCTYCFNHSFQKLFKGCGPIIRKKSVDYLLEEIRNVRINYPLKTVVFNDDTFILNNKWFLEFCEQYPRKIGIPYGCNVRADLINEEIVEALCASNCIAVNWSIESGNDFFRNTVLKRNMTKEQIIRAGSLLNKYGIQHRIGNIIGLPGEIIEQMFETVELNIRAKPTLALANIFVPFPGLELTQYAIEKGYYNEVSRKDLPKNYFTKSSMKVSSQGNVTVQKMMCLFPLFVRFPWLFYNIRVRRIAFFLPKLLLRLIYEAVFAFKLRSIYRVRASFVYNIRLATRYILDSAKSFF